MVSSGIERSAETIVGIGPELPDIGSWQWVGADFVAALQNNHSIVVWSDSPPVCDLLVVIKYGFENRLLQQVSGIPIIYCPVDAYGSSSEIDAHGSLLRQCSRIICHSRSLVRYFGAYAPAKYLDHAVRYITDTPVERIKDGPVLWIGHRSNLPPLISWVKRTGFSERLWLLSNFDSSQLPSAGELELQHLPDLRIDCWTPKKHIGWTAQARGAIDIKASDFRQRHKPPAKALDFIASGLPLAVESSSAAALHLAEMGFETASPDDPEYWFSDEYWTQTRRFGGAVRELLSKERVGNRIRRVVRSVLGEREGRT